MSQSPTAALHLLLHEAEEFIAHGEETDDLRQQIGAWLRVQLRRQITALEAELRAEVARTGQWGGGDDPTVRPTTLEEVLDAASALVWQCEDILMRAARSVGKDDWHWHYWSGAQKGAYMVLQRCGALPIGPMRRSSDELHRSLVAVRAVLPDGFELMPAWLAYQFLATNGVELTSYEAPYLQRHLVAGLRKQKDVVAAPPPVGRKLDGEQLPVGTDLDDSASPHRAASKVEAADHAATQGGAA